jgi:hypothetical protein
VQQIDTFAAGVVGAEPHYGVFLACSTRQDEVMPGGDVDDHRWVAGRGDLDELRDQLFHPLIEDLALTRLRDESIWPLQ